MSKKQLGAVPGEESAPESQKPLRWFGRLGAQPGFRAAVVAFVLTVVLGVGGTAAYALWSTSFPATVTAMAPKLPMVAERPTCNRWAVPTKLEWKRPADMPADAYFIVEFSQTNKNKPPVTYAMLENGIEPYNFRVGTEDFNSWMGGSYYSPTNLSMSVRVGALAPGSAPRANSPIKVSDLAQIVSSSDSSPAMSFVGTRSLIFGIYTYDC